MRLGSTSETQSGMPFGFHQCLHVAAEAVRFAAVPRIDLEAFSRIVGSVTRSDSVIFPSRIR